MTSDHVERTVDRRHIIVDGRKWRASDPSIPDRFRAELVAQLMSSRRSVKTSKQDTDQLATARAGVHDAKIALGERGEPWWDEPSDAGRHQRTASTIRTLLRHRGPDSSICPSEVARTIASPNWRPALDHVRDVGAELAANGDIAITQSGQTVSDPFRTRGPVRYAIGANLHAIHGG